MTETLKNFSFSNDIKINVNEKKWLLGEKQYLHHCSCKSIKTTVYR